MVNQDQFGSVPDQRQGRTFFVSREDMATDKAALRIQANGGSPPGRGQLELPFSQTRVGFVNLRRKSDPLPG